MGYSGRLTRRAKKLAPVVGVEGDLLIAHVEAPSTDDSMATWNWATFEYDDGRRRKGHFIRICPQVWKRATREMRDYLLLHELVHAQQFEDLGETSYGALQSTGPEEYRYPWEKNPLEEDAWKRSTHLATVIGHIQRDQRDWLTLLRHRIYGLEAL